MAGTPKYSLFEVFGIELEYMIVDRTTLKVRPITDLLFQDKCGEIVSDLDNGEIEWSNELVAHVVEIKTNGPTDHLAHLDELFFANINEINRILKKHNAMLLPTAAHPLMDPYTETTLWQHEHNEVYALYNKIFDCRGHGWSNLQSMHINFPFKNDEEFEKLHAAIRLVLPLIPALCASSPILDGKLSGYIDTRMETYLHNQEKIPTLMGKLIPEQVFSHAEYNERIFQPIIKDIKPYDTEGVTDEHFLNSRGAIARFDRCAIEIRVIDLQECPLADVALASLIIETVRSLTKEKWSTLVKQKTWHEDELLAIFMKTIKDGENAIIDNPSYLELFGIEEKNITTGHLWKLINREITEKLPINYRDTINTILEYGTLSNRIITALDGDESPEAITRVYKDLADCLEKNQLYIP